MHPVLDLSDSGSFFQAMRSPPTANQLRKNEPPGLGRSVEALDCAPRYLSVCLGSPKLLILFLIVALKRGRPETKFETPNYVAQTLS